jgi:hypothetical protein
MPVGLDARLSGAAGIKVTQQITTEDLPPTADLSFVFLRRIPFAVCPFTFAEMLSEVSILLPSHTPEPQAKGSPLIFPATAMLPWLARQESQA